MSTLFTSFCLLLLMQSCASCFYFFFAFPFHTTTPSASSISCTHPSQSLHSSFRISSFNILCIKKPAELFSRFPVAYTIDHVCTLSGLNMSSILLLLPLCTIRSACVCTQYSPFDFRSIFKYRVCSNRCSIWNRRQQKTPLILAGLVL